jgi:hypothetical protein
MNIKPNSTEGRILDVLRDRLKRNADPMLVIQFPETKPLRNLIREGLVRVVPHPTVKDGKGKPADAVELA